jgi:prepilin-type N-terminal cleavage/methylation domain-containing protein
MNLLNKPASESGFTLVEVIVSLMLLALVGLLVGASLMEANTASANNSMHAAANELLNKELDRIRTNVVTCSRLNLLTTGNFGNSNTTTPDGKQLVSSVKLVKPVDCSTQDAAAELEVVVKNGKTVVASANSIFEISPG